MQPLFALTAMMPMDVTKVNLAGQWTKFWNAVIGAYPGLGNLLTFVGMALVIFALVKWAWDRRRGGSMGQGSAPLWGALIPGAILAAPTIIFPILLRILDWVANMVFQLIKAGTGTTWVN